jgi:membrane protein implicated in regulation of membrane protease activity
MLQWELWFIGAFILFIIEIITPGTAVSIWFCFGCLVSMILALFNVPLQVQIWVFVIVSFLSLFLLRKLALSKIAVKPVPTNTDRVIGREAIVAEKIPANKQVGGRVLVDGTDWAAVCDEEVAIGKTVTVEAIEGVKLVVKRNNPAQEKEER